MSSANEALIDAFKEEFAIAARGGLEDFLHAVEDEARRLAPVRKVFKAGGRRKLAWRDVFSSTSSQKGMLAEYAHTFGRYAAPGRTQGLRIVEKSGRRTLQVRTYKNQEPYSSESRRNWTKISPATYNLRMGSLASAKGNRLAEPLLRTEGGAEYAFADFDRLNYEGRRQLTRGMAIYGAKGLGREYLDTHLGGLITVAGSETGRRSQHVEEFGGIPENAPRYQHFSSDWKLQLGGALRKSIEMTPPEVSGSRITGGVAASVRYAIYVEFGTAEHGAAQPYLRPALMRYRYLLAKSVGSNVRHR